MLQRARKWLIISLLIAAVGGHWVILQSVAWAQMLVRCSHGTTLGRGFTKTFGGKHPCKLCQLVKEGRKTERKQEMLKLGAKFEFTLLLVRRYFIRRDPTSNRLSPMKSRRLAFPSHPRHHLVPSELRRATARRVSGAIHFQL